MPAKKASVVMEFGIFCIGTPLIIAMIVGVFDSLGGRPAPPVMGIRRSLFLAVPLLSACAISLILGVVLLATRKAWAVVGCVVAGGLITLSYLVPFTIALGMIPLNTVTVAAVAIPVLMIVRAPKAIAEIRRGASSGRIGPPPVPPPLPPSGSPPLDD